MDAAIHPCFVLIGVIRCGVKSYNRLSKSSLLLPSSLRFGLGRTRLAPNAFATSMATRASVAVRIC